MRCHCSHLFASKLPLQVKFVKPYFVWETFAIQSSLGHMRTNCKFAETLGTMAKPFPPLLSTAATPAAALQARKAPWQTPFAPLCFCQRLENLVSFNAVLSLQLTLQDIVASPTKLILLYSSDRHCFTKKTSHFLLISHIPHSIQTTPYDPPPS